MRAAPVAHSAAQCAHSPPESPACAALAAEHQCRHHLQCGHEWLGTSEVWPRVVTCSCVLYSRPVVVYLSCTPPSSPTRSHRKPAAFCTGHALEDVRTPGCVGARLRSHAVHIAIVPQRSCTFHCTFCYLQGVQTVCKELRKQAAALRITGMPHGQHA
jgi:hypothetical protein